MKIARLAAAAVGLLLSPLQALAAECGEVSIAEMNWPSAELLANLDAIILEEGYGCDVTLIRGATTTTFASMVEKGEPDVAPELWINAFREPLKKAETEGRLHTLSNSPISGTAEGWWVSKAFRQAHPELDTVEKVLRRPDLFPHPEDASKGAFMTCPAGWGCQLANANLFRAFKMEAKGWRLLDPGTAAGLDGAIAKAAQRGEHWFGYYWSPNAIVAKYDLRRLPFETPWAGEENWEGCITQPAQRCLDPKPSSWSRSEVRTVVADGAMKAGGPAIAYFSRRVVPADAMNDMLAHMSDTQASGAAAARKFLEDYPQIWTAWVNEAAIKRVNSQISGGGGFPAMDRGDLAALKQSIDRGFLDFARAYGESLETFFKPLLWVLVGFEALLLGAPWPLVLAAVGALAWVATRSWIVTAGTLLALTVIGYFGMWEDTMATLAIISVATLVCVLVGIPVGVLMARSDRAQTLITPILDVMQTIPSFVYLIPVVMLLGIGKVPGLLAVCVYAIPPIVRLTNLGLRLVDRNLLEAADAFGASPREKLTGVQLPLALPTIFAGVNQTIMMALSMVVIASMIGVQGLGQPVLRAISNQYLALGLMNGLAIVALAIMFDRISQSFGRRLQTHRDALGK